MLLVTLSLCSLVSLLFSVVFSCFLYVWTVSVLAFGCIQLCLFWVGCGIRLDFGYVCDFGECLFGCLLLCGLWLVCGVVVDCLPYF